MPLKAPDLLLGGLPYELANKLGFDTLTAVTAAGTTSTGATALNCNFANVTTSSIGAGVIITEPATTGYIYNIGPDVLTVYPPSGDNFVNLAANAGVQVAATKALTYIGGGTAIAANISA